MNKDNFKILIDAILFDGQVRFNMSCFIGKLNINAGTYKQEIKEQGIYASNYGPQNPKTPRGCISNFN